MKTLLLALCFVIATVAQAAEPMAVLTLHNGAIYKQARIVAFTGESVTIIHTGGSVTVPAEQVDLEILARAKMEIAERDAARNQKLSDATTVAAERKKESDQRSKEKLDLAVAESAVRERSRSSSAKLTGTRPAASGDIEGKIRALKAAFPPKQIGQVTVQIVDKTNKQGRVVKGRNDVITYEVPSIDVYSWYRGAFQTTTLQALPHTLQLVEQRIAEDSERILKIGGGESARVQADQSLRWFDHNLRPYIERWRALLR